MEKYKVVWMNSKNKLSARKYDANDSDHAKEKFEKNPPKTLQHIISVTLVKEKNVY